MQFISYVTVRPCCTENVVDKLLSNDLMAVYLLFITDQFVAVLNSQSAVYLCVFMFDQDEL